MRDDVTTTTDLMTATAKALSSTPDEEFILRGVHDLPDAIAFLIRGCISDIDLSCITSLSGAAAVALSRHQGRLDLGGLTELPHDVAVGLACREDTEPKVLALNGVTQLDGDAAAAIARYPGGLELNGLRSISAHVAQALASHRGRLSLNGINTIDRKVAVWLATHRGELSLHGIENLDDECASALMTHDGKVSLAGIVSLTPATARLASCRNAVLYFPKVTHLSEAAAEALVAVRHEQKLAEDQWMPVKGQLFLTGLQDLTVEAARCLSRFYGTVALHGVKLTPAVAAVLKNNGQGICFRHLTSLSRDEAATVARFYGPLDLTGLTSLDPESAAHLAKHIGGPLYLDGLTELSGDVAEALRAHTGPLSLNGVTVLSNAVAQQLSQHRDDLSLGGVKTLSVVCAMLLAKRKFGTAVDGLVNVDATTSKILKGIRPCTRLPASEVYNAVY